jgi:hypothetical protein
VEVGFFVLAVVACLLASLIGGGHAPSPLALRRQPDVDRVPLAQACGLVEIETAPDGTVTGRHGALRVRLETLRGLPYGLVRIRVDGLARGVHVVAAASRSQDARDVTVGDPAFDAAVLLQGAPPTVRGLFGARQRDQALRAFAIDARVEIRDGAMTAEIDEMTATVTPLEAKLAVLLDLAHALEPGAGDEQRLGEIVRGDRHPGVRAAALETLAQVADRPRARDVLRAIVKEGPPAFRLQSAVALGEEGRPSLHALAADRAIDDGVSAAAVAALGGHVTFARATPLLECAVADGRPQTATALLKVMGRGGPAEAATVAGVLDRLDATSPEHSAIGRAAVDALVATTVPEAEPALVRALGSPFEDVALSAVRGLERVGTVGAVSGLREAEERGGSLRAAARRAIAAIQARRPGASPGQVSLSTDAGHVSIADAAAGRVSLDTDGS